MIDTIMPQSGQQTIWWKIDAHPDFVSYVLTYIFSRRCLRYSPTNKVDSRSYLILKPLSDRLKSIENIAV